MDTTKIKLETGIELPPKTRAGKWAEISKQLRHGHSFVVPKDSALRASNGIKRLILERKLTTFVRSVDDKTSRIFIRLIEDPKEIAARPKPKRK